MSLPARLAGVFLVMVACSSTATAQTRRGPWEIDVHAGGRIAATNPSGGTPLATFPVGSPIATGGGTSTTRALSSWYFGDGTELLNEANARLGVTTRLTPLDPVLTRALAERKEKPAIGIRVARYLTRRAAVEFAVDYAPSRLEMRDGVAAAVEESRASFVTAWTRLLETGATTNRVVTSTAAFTDGNGHDITATGAVRIHFADTGRLHPYVTGGAGASFYSGTLPSATLTGNYGFLFGDVFPVNERDIATITVRRPDRAVVGLFGGGLDYDFSSRHGLRFDVRVDVRPSKVDTIVSARPFVTMQTPAFVVSTGTLPSIQFSNSALFARPSSLSGPDVTDSTTFTGSGAETRVRASIGYVFRF
jgi:hypothetical protein